MPFDKLISVVIPCYNHEKYIQKTIRSVLNQTYGNLEILIADDCSPDASVSLIREIKDPRIKTFFFEENHGTVYTLNYLLKRASGAYIATLGSDDYFAPDKLEKQITAMEENPSLGAVFSWAEIVDENDNLYTSGNSISLSEFQEPNRTRGEWLRYFFEDGNHLCHSSALIRRDVQENIGLYHAAYRQLHDFDMWIRLLCKHPIYVIPEKLTYYRRENRCTSVSSNSGKNTVRLFNEYNSIFLWLFQNMDADLFHCAFAGYLPAELARSECSVEEEKYMVLRQLKLAGCQLRGASQKYFISCLDHIGFQDIPDPKMQELLALYYSDSAKGTIDYPATAEVLACILPGFSGPPAKAVKLGVKCMLLALRRVFSYIPHFLHFKR